MTRPLRIYTILTELIVVLLLPVLTNVAASVLPDFLHSYLWLAWPGALTLAAWVIVAEFRRNRSQPPMNAPAPQEKHFLQQKMADRGASVYQAGRDLIMMGQPTHSRVQVSRRTILLTGALFVGLVTAAVLGLMNITRSDRCAAPYPVELQLPERTGSSFGVTMTAVCDLDTTRHYLLIEKVPNVDVNNPHPACYIKAQLAGLLAGQSSSSQILLKEPVGTRAEFYVISVDNTGYRQLGQNRIVDNGLLELPSTHRQESPSLWHEKAWE